MSAARAAAATTGGRLVGRSGVRGAAGPGALARTASGRAPAARAVRPGAAASRSAAPSRRPEQRPAAEPRVRLLPPPPSSRRRLPFGVLCGVLVLASLLAVLSLNISLSHGAYHLHEVQARQQAAAEQRQALTETLERTSSPEELGRRAAGLGMVPAGAAGFVTLPDGTVVGEPVPAPEPPPAPEEAATDPADGQAAQDADEQVTDEQVTDEQADEEAQP
ncbi:hypothetical protein [Pseudokineococcus sp. 1T1Z-3]|uniref:hypothetical protein n=1 Tax=Pseudokineococcus sp. 1T1Z-3 TaxID=3132745 RepID=UPI003096FEFD